MKATKLFFTLLATAVLALPVSCQGKKGGTQKAGGREMPKELADSAGLASIRAKYVPESFAHFLQHFPREATKEVKTWDGTTLPTTSLGVLDIDVPEFQQCADAVIRLHAEWLYKQGRFSNIHYNFTNGFNCDFTHWAHGWRVRVNGNDASWYRDTNEENFSHDNFIKYIGQVFYYAGTISISEEMEQVRDGKAEVGDAFVIAGSPGHAVIVADKIIVRDSTYYLFAQSWTPAQDIEIISGKNLASGAHYKEYVGWKNEEEEIEISGYTFTPKKHLRRWRVR